MHSVIAKNNKMCYCGSGKKQKKCCKDKKPVIESAMFEYAEPTLPATFTIGPNGELGAFDAAGKFIVFREASYIRSHLRNSKGEKMLTKIPMASPILPRHELEYLLSFHDLYAIDTNTDKKTKISAATVIRCSLTKLDQQVLAESEIVDQRYWVDLDVNPEKVAIQSLTLSVKYLPGTRIGIINDCDLGNMSKINSREIPLIDDYYMPSAFTLIYASSDSGKDALSNQLMVDCDTYSSQMLLEIKSNLDKYIPQKYT